MQQHTKHIKFNFKFNTEKLLLNLRLAEQQTWTPHFNTAGYQGNWKAISLYAANGDGSNIFALPNSEAPILETAILKKCPYFKEVIDSFKCPILSARVLKLEPGALIKPHQDHQLGYEDNCFRLHIPISTNDGVCFTLDNEKLTMLPGQCWYTNVNYTHSVVNNGPTDRIHLVIDGARNHWSDNLFFSYAPAKSFIPPSKEESPETIRRMIEELSKSNLKYAPELINDLQKKC